MADDYIPYRALVREVLEAAGFQVRAEVGDAGAALQAVLEHRPGFALLDVRMPGGGPQAARAIKTANPSTFVIMITVSEDSTDFYEALRAGASGYVLKGGDPSRLPRSWTVLWPEKQSRRQHSYSKWSTRYQSGGT